MSISHVKRYYGNRARPTYMEFRNREEHLENH